MDGEPSATLVIRVWLEDGDGDGDGDGFRARLTSARVANEREAGNGVAVAVAASVEQVIDAVRGWLDEFTRA
jgi:hypothetical protein